MAQIKEYNQQVDAVSNTYERPARPDQFVTSGSNAGAGLQNFGQALAAEAEKDDVTNVHVMMAKARADWTAHLDDTVNHTGTKLSMTTGNVDGEQASAPTPTVSVGSFANNYMGDLGNFLTDAKQNVRTRAGGHAFDQLAANLSGDLQIKAMGAQAHLEGIKAAQDYGAVLNSYRSSLIGHPEDFSRVLKESEDALAGWTNIPAEQRIALVQHTSEQLALSAVQGEVRQDPVDAMKQLNDGQWDTYLTGDKKYYALHQAQNGINAEYTRRNQEIRDAEKAEALMRMKVNDGFMEQFVKGQLTTRSVLDSSLHPFGEGSKETWLAMMDKQNRDGLKPVKTDPAWAQATFAAIHAPAGDPNKMLSEDALNQGYIDGKVNREDLAFFRKELQDDRTPEGQRLGVAKQQFYDGFKKQFDKSTLQVPDPTGGEQFFMFQQHVEQAVANAKAANKDPQKLFDPESPDYLGRDAKRYQLNFSQQMQRMQEGMNRAPGIVAPNGAVPDDQKRLPGETPAQWLKRTGPK